MNMYGIKHCIKFKDISEIMWFFNVGLFLKNLMQSILYVKNISEYCSTLFFFLFGGSWQMKFSVESLCLCG